MIDRTDLHLEITNLQTVPELREERLRAPESNIVLANFEFSSGKAGQIVVSRRIAPTEGMQLMVVAKDPKDGSFTQQELSDAVFVSVQFMAEHAHLCQLGNDPKIGYQIAINRGGMKNKFDAPDHVQIIIPGSERDRQLAPRLTDPWSA